MRDQSPLPYDGMSAQGRIPPSCLPDQQIEDVFNREML